MASFQNSDVFWELFLQQSIVDFELICKDLFITYGTALPCNRFDVGNCIEFAIGDMLKEGGVFEVGQLSNAKRVDISLKGFGSLSIKYSSSGNIRLHNSLGGNKDKSMTDTLLVTPREIIFLHVKTMKDLGVDPSSFMKDTTDALELKRSILKALTNVGYKYVRKIDIICNKKDCLNHQCSQVIYEDVKRRLGINKKTDNTADIMMALMVMTLLCLTTQNAQPSRADD